jgi:O-antigen ligase
MNRLAYAAVWLYAFSLPWEGVIRIGGTAVVTRVTGAIAVGCALLSIVVYGRVRRLHPFHLAVFLFITVLTLNLLVFHPNEPLPNRFWTFIRLALVLWVMWELAPTFPRVLGLFTAYVLGSYVAALQTILLFRREGQALRRFAAGDVDPNDLAMILAISLPMAWYLGMTYHNHILRWACRSYIPICLIAIGLTGSRGGMFATMVALVIVPLSMRKLTPGQLALAITLLCISGALAVSYVPEKTVERLATTTTEVQDMRLGGRFKIWRAGLKAFTKKPLMGYGTSSFIGAVYPYLGSQSLVAHNSYISVLVEQGLIGFTFFTMMFLTVFWGVRRLPPSERRFGLVLLATVCVAMLPLSWEDRKQVWFVLAALIGLAQARGWRAGVAQPVRAPAAPIETPWAARGRQPLTARAPDRGSMT